MLTQAVKLHSTAGVEALKITWFEKLFKFHVTRGRPVTLCMSVTACHGVKKILPVGSSHPLTLGPLNANSYPYPRVFDMLQYFKTIWEKQLCKEWSHAIARTDRGDDNNNTPFSVKFLINASVNSTCAQPPSGQLRGICPPCQSRGWGICKCCTARGPGICQPPGQSRAFDTHAVSYQNITTQKVLLEKKQIGSFVKDRNKL